MSEPKAQEQEPSMEEILASIRRIISEDGGDEGEKAEVGAKPKRPAKPEAVAGAAMPEPAGDNVLELTRVVQDDGSVVNLKDARSEAEEEIEVAGEPEPEPEPEPELEPEPEPEPEPVMATPPPAAMAPARSAGTLLSQETAAASGAAFAQLARMVQVSDEPLRVSARGRTIEDIVVEMLRPLLKDWLDTNLPPLVERLVKSEIERIVQGQGGRAL